MEYSLELSLMLLKTKRPWVQREGIAQYFMLFVVLSESLLIFGAITIYKHGAPKQDLPFSSQVLRPGLTESFSIFTKALNLANIVRPTLDSAHIAELLHSKESLSPAVQKPPSLIQQTWARKLLICFCCSLTTRFSSVSFSSASRLSL